MFSHGSDGLPGGGGGIARGGSLQGGGGVPAQVLAGWGSQARLPRPMYCLAPNTQVCSSEGDHRTKLATSHLGERGRQTTLATTEAHTTPASTTKEHAPLTEVHTTPTETMKVRAMPTCTMPRDGVIGPHVCGSVGGQVADDQDNTVHGKACDGRPGCRGEWGSKNPKRNPATTSTAPVRQLLGPANADTTPQGTQTTAAVGTQRPDAACCPGPCTETATRWNVTQGGQNCQPCLNWFLLLWVHTPCTPISPSTPHSPTHSCAQLHVLHNNTSRHLLAKQ